MKYLVFFFWLLWSPGIALAQETWAVYWYVCGSDLERTGGAASEDIAEMMEVTLPDNVTVVLQTGGAGAWQNSVMSPNHIGRFIYKKNDLIKMEELPQANMGDEKTLADFLAYCQKNFPADRQILVFWDHGGGSVNGLANDENFDMDALSLIEVRNALQRVFKPSQENPPLDIVGFDTCLMATLETANIFDGFAKYMVASQELEPGNGWEYTGWMSALGKKNLSSAELGKIICDTYYKGCQEWNSEDTATLSVIDLAKLPALNASYNALGLEAVTVAVERPNFYTQLGRQAKASENYMNSKSEGYTNMVDLGSLVRNLAPELTEFTDYFLSALDEAVVYQVSGPYRKPSGLSVYYPYDGNQESYEVMMDTGNITSFLVLNGLQHDFIDGDEAINHLERIAEQVSIYVEDDGEDYGDDDEESPSAPAVSPPPVAVQPSVPVQPSIPAGTGMNQGLGMFVQTVQNVFASVAPLPQLDISALEDFPVTISDDGAAELNLGPERVEFIDSIYFYLSYYDVDDDIIVMLGKDSDMDADWDNGVFRDNFRGVWPALDGHLVYMEITHESDNANHYVIPLMLNGERCNLLVVYDFDQEAYRILGARRMQTNNVIDKKLIKLKSGDKIVTLLKAMTISGDDDEFVDAEIDEFTLGENIVFEDIDLGDGTFLFMYEMTDVQQNTAMSESVSIEVKDGEIYVENI